MRMLAMLVGVILISCDKPSTSATTAADAQPGASETSARATAPEPAPSTPATVPSAPDAGGVEAAAPAPGTTAPASDRSAWTVAENSALKGRMGRIIVVFPKDAPAKETRIAVFKSGDSKEIGGAYAKLEQELLPGNYDVVVGGRRVVAAPVKSKYDTTIIVGILRVSAGKETHIKILDTDKKTELISFYGSQDVGLPIGKYHVQVAGQSEPVEVKAGQVTEF